MILLTEGFVVDVQGQKGASVTGMVVDEAGVPISGANVTLLTFHDRIPLKKVRTDDEGRFHATVNMEGSCLVYVTYDDRKTPGVDYVPERWRTWLSADSVSSHNFVLKKGASIYLEGEIRYVKTSRVATRYRFDVIEIKGGGGEDRWTGPLREYGSYSDFARSLGFDERLVVVPADTEVKIRVIAYFPGRYYHSFTLAGRMGYFKLSQGKILHVDVRERNILSNIQYVKGLLDSGFSLLYNCRTAGFLVEVERRDLLNAYNAIGESLILLKKGLFDQSFAKVRSAYILSTEADETLSGLIHSSSQSLLPLLFLFVFIAYASAYLISEKSSCIEMMIGKERFSISITHLLDLIFYALLVTLFFLVFPGCRLVSQSSFISMTILTFIIGKAIFLIFSWYAREEKGGNRPIQFKSAIAVAFSMATRNLRRRKIRTAINLISIMIFVFGLITLTSISLGYGLSRVELRPVLPIDALLIRDVPIGTSPGSFVSLPESFFEWLESNSNITLIAPKAENTPVTLDNPLGRLYTADGKWISILGVIGIVPSKEANITGIDQIINEGNYLKDEDLNGVLISSSLRELLNVDVGDRLYGFGQEFIIRGFFDEESILNLVDVHGALYIPYFISENYVSPCPPNYVIVVNYEKALTLPKVSTSRVVVQLNNTKGYESLAKIIAYTYDYKVYVSHPGSLVLYSLGEYIEARGVELIFPLMVLVMLNIGLSMFAAVNERRNEIATLSSVGLNPTHIAALFVAEALIIGFIGGGFGYLMGISGYRFASLIGGFQVREKVSADWGVTSILLSGFTAAFASLIPALRSSTLVTPSLLRKWRIEESERQAGTTNTWIFDLPLKLLAKELESFTAFIIRRLQSTRARAINVDEEASEKGIVKKISFIYDLPERGWTNNEIIIQPGEKEYDLKLICSLHGSSSLRALQPLEAVRMTATYVRKILLEWSAATCEVLTSFDPYLGRLYNLINTYSPTTLYVVSTTPDIHDRIDAFKEALISRGIRPPKFAVVYADSQDLKQMMEAIKDLVSRVDIVCVSGEDVLLCSSLAMEAVRQGKTICHVIDNRLVEDRMKNPFQNLKVISIFS